METVWFPSPYVPPNVTGRREAISSKDFLWNIECGFENPPQPKNNKHETRETRQTFSSLVSSKSLSPSLPLSSSLFLSTVIAFYWSHSEEHSVIIISKNGELPSCLAIQERIVDFPTPSFPMIPTTENGCWGWSDSIAGSCRNGEKKASRNSRWGIHTFSLKASHRSRTEMGEEDSTRIWVK